MGQSLNKFFWCSAIGTIFLFDWFSVNYWFTLDQNFDTYDRFLRYSVLCQKSRITVDVVSIKENHYPPHGDWGNWFSKYSEIPDCQSWRDQPYCNFDNGSQVRVIGLEENIAESLFSFCISTCFFNIPKNRDSGGLKKAKIWIIDLHPSWPFCGDSTWPRMV